MQRLAREGLLVSPEPGSRRRITLPEDAQPRSLRVGLFIYERTDVKADYIIDLLHKLNEAGHMTTMRPMINRIVKWAENVARGKDDRHQTFTKAEFIEVGTIGPAPKER